MKKKAIAATFLVGVLMLGGGTAYAAGQIVRSGAMEETAIQNFAFVDAGVLPEDATITHTEFEFEKGTLVYEMDFSAGDVKYEYTVDATNGRIIEKEWKSRPAGAGTTGSRTAVTPTRPAKREYGTSGNRQTAEVIGMDQAKEIAMKDAGVTAESVVFGKVKLERDDGRQIYDIEFYIPDTKEYEYEIDAETGAVLEAKTEEWNTTNPTSGKPASNAAGSRTRRNSGAGTPSTETQTSASTSDNSKEMISVDEAKAIALERAGQSAEAVVFSKVKLEHDDGKLLYDIEFYVYGESEYEYEIDAYSGAVLDEDMERWEQYRD